MRLVSAGLVPGIQVPGTRVRVAFATVLSSRRAVEVGTGGLAENIAGNAQWWCTSADALMTVGG